MPSRTINCVQEHFRAEAAYWKEVYLRGGLVPTTYQERRSVVLALVDRLALPGNSNVLDVGCGAGFTAVALAQRGYAVTATDNIQPMIDATRDLAAQSGLGKRVMVGLGDAHHLPFRANLFELVLAIGLVSWLQSPKDAMREIARVLRPGGCLILTVGNRWALYQWLDPVSFPPLRPVRRRVRKVVERFGFHAFQERKPRPQWFSIEAGFAPRRSGIGEV
jgi:SAM-dependent methyltransferase